MDYDFRAIARNNGGLEGLVEVMSAYEFAEGQSLRSNSSARDLFLAIIKKMGHNGQIRLGDFPQAEAIRASLAVEDMDYVAGICFMCVVAANGWNVLRFMSQRLTDDDLASEGITPAYLAGMTLGIFGGISWEYTNINHYGNSGEEGCLYADYPPDFVADVLTSNGFNSGGYGQFDDGSHPVFGRLTNLLPNFIAGPPNRPLCHEVHLQHMFVRLQSELSGLMTEAIEPARTIADKMYFRFAKTLTPEERLAMAANGFARSLPENGTP